MRRFIISIALLVSCSLNAYQFIRHTDNLDQSRFFDTSFISNYPAVKKVLCEEEGFNEILFSTPAGHVLEGLVRTVDRPDFTVIFCSGFIPGKQEGIATFITMMPKNCNILFFNGHGKGRSTGLLRFMNLLHYGRYDYLDTLGAIECMHSINQGPLYIHGICAGAFHAAHALYHLRDRGAQYHIRGFICDSIWASVDQAALGVVHDILHRTSSRIVRACLQTGQLFARYVASPLVRRYAQETDLLHKFSEISVPTLFIHSYDDTLTAIEPAQALARTAQAAECWWIDKPSRHACHHLKHKYEYAQKIAQFIERTLAKND